jgi:hypothetical protein
MLEFLNALPRVEEKRRGCPELLDELNRISHTTIHVGA